jgi:hypothetical protein
MMTGTVLWMALVMFGTAGIQPGSQETKPVTEPPRIRVSPAICLEPALVEVTVRIPPSPDNRRLSVTIDAEDYYTSSTTELDGERAPAMRVFSYRSLPAGHYTVTVTLEKRPGHSTIAEYNFRVLGRADGGASLEEDVPVAPGDQQGLRRHFL